MALLSKTAFNPFFTGPLLLLLTQAPESIRGPVLQYLQDHVSQNVIAGAITALKWLTAFGAYRWAADYLGELGQNNWRLKSEAHRYDWPNEIAVITGGTGGFGQLMAKGLSEKGVKVIAIDVRDEAPKIMQGNPKIAYYKCDITDPEAVKFVAECVKKEHGDPSILINNAGVANDGPILKMSPEKLTGIFGVNIISHYYLVQAFLPAMCAAKKGHIVSLASMASFVTQAGMVPYCNTKAAVLSFHEGLAQETRVWYGAPEIKFTCVHPTFASTPLVAPFEKELKKGGAQVIKPEMVTDAIVKQIFSGRGRQILIAPDNWMIAPLRGWPQWVQQVIMTATDKGKGEQLQLHSGGVGGGVVG